MTDLLLHLSALAAGSLVATAWQTVLLVAVVALYLRLLPRGGPELRYTAWSALLPVIFLLPVISSLAGASSPSVTSRIPFRPSTPILHPLLHLDSRWSVALASLWAALSLLRAVQLGVGALRLRSIARSATPISAPGAYTTSLSTTHHRSATLCTTDSAEITQPSVVGFRHPRILIPARMYASLIPSDLHQIVLHELEHLRRRDDWMNLAQKLALVLFPLNPALLWVERRLCQERELACDNGVLRSTAAPKLYASCLVHLAEERIRFRQMPLALGAWARRSELARRIDHILKTRANTASFAYARPATVFLVLGLLGGSALLARGGQLISFTSPATTPLEAASLSNSMLLPASYKPLSYAGGQHATYVKALMPSPAQATYRSKLAGHNPASLPAKVKHPRRPQRFVLTSGHAQAPSFVPRLILAADEGIDLSHTYAAVPTPGGWIFFTTAPVIGSWMARTRCGVYFTPPLASVALAEASCSMVKLL